MEVLTDARLFDVTSAADQIATAIRIRAADPKQDAAGGRVAGEPMHVVAGRALELAVVVQQRFRDALACQRSPFPAG